MSSCALTPPLPGEPEPLSTYVVTLRAGSDALIVEVGFHLSADCDLDGSGVAFAVFQIDADDFEAIVVSRPVSCGVSRGAATTGAAVVLAAAVSVAVAGAL